MSSDSETDVQAEIQSIINSNIDHLKFLKQKVIKNEYTNNQLSSIYEQLVDNYNALDKFLQTETGNQTKSQVKGKSKAKTDGNSSQSIQSQTKKAARSSKKSFQDNDRQILKPESSESDNSNDEDNSKNKNRSSSSTSSTQKRKSSQTSAVSNNSNTGGRKKKMNRYLDQQVLCLNENDE